MDYDRLNDLISDYFDLLDKDGFYSKNLMMIGRFCQNILKKEYKEEEKTVEVDSLKTLSLASEFFLSVNKSYSKKFEVAVKDTKINFYEKELEKIANAINIPSKGTLEDIFTLTRIFLTKIEKNPLKILITLELLPDYLKSQGYEKQTVNYYFLKIEKQKREAYSYVSYFGNLFEIYLNYFKINERSIYKVLNDPKEIKEFKQMSQKFLQNSYKFSINHMVSYGFDSILAFIIASKMKENANYFKYYFDLNGKDYDTILKEFHIEKDRMDILYLNALKKVIKG